MAAASPTLMLSMFMPVTMVPGGDGDLLGGVFGLGGGGDTTRFDGGTIHFIPSSETCVCRLGVGLVLAINSSALAINSSESS